MMMMMIKWHFNRPDTFLINRVKTLRQQVLKVLWTRMGVRATFVTAGHCTHAELTGGHTLASCYSCYVYSLPGLC